MSFHGVVSYGLWLTMQSSFHKFWFIVLVLNAFLCGRLAQAEEVPHTNLSPLSIYGEEIRFDVLRNGKKRGWHRTRFTGQDNELIVRSSFSMHIDFLFLTAFRYDYESEALWRSGQLFQLKSTTDDNGNISSVEVSRNGDAFSISSTKLAYHATAPLFPTNHWHAGVIYESQVINTITGRINDVDIRSMGREAVTTENGLTEATRYVYSGDLETEVWYDDYGRWVKMRFIGQDGSTIEYLCRRCQNINATGVQK